MTLCSKLAITDLLHKLLNIVLPPLTFIALLLLMLIFGLLEFHFSLKRYIYMENVASKVALITRASSGIGEVCMSVSIPNHLYIFINSVEREGESLL